jgi:hypothetical protein
MGRPKHSCEKPPSPYIEFVETTAPPVTTTISPELNLVRYSHGAGCVDLTPVDLIPYASFNKNFDIYGSNPCTTTVIKSVFGEHPLLPKTRGVIANFSICNQGVRTVLIPHNDTTIISCVTTANDSSFVSGDGETSQLGGCGCDEFLPEPPEVPVAQPQTTIPPLPVPVTTPDPIGFTVNYITHSATLNYSTDTVIDTIKIGLTLTSRKYEEHERYIQRMAQGQYNHIWKLRCVPYNTSVFVPLDPPAIGSRLSNDLDWANEIVTDINIYTNKGGLGTDSWVNDEQTIELPNPFATFNPGVAPPLHLRIAWRIFIEEPWFDDTFTQLYEYAAQIYGHSNDPLNPPGYSQ